MRMRKRYDERVLDLLLDRYERSLLSEGRNRRNIRITQKIDRTHFPEYFDEASLEALEIHEQLSELERKGLVALIWRERKKGHILEECVLNADRIEDAYAFLHRTSKNVKKTRLFDVLARYEQKLPCFTEWAETRIREGSSVRKYIDENDPKSLERVLKLASAVLENNAPQYLRSFSIEVFHDSKIAEHELFLAASVITHFERTDLPSGLTAYEVFEEFGIFRNPTFLFIKGYGIREPFKEGVGVFQDDMDGFLRALTENPEKESSGPDVILTIENLTSFHQWDPSLQSIGKRELVIYLAGYANRVKRSFLKDLHRIYPKASFFHFGDMDAGGFRIWKNLSEETGIPIKTWRMDLPAFEKYKSAGRPLTTGDRAGFRKMLEDPFFSEQGPLFSKILEENCKIEQESIRQ